MHSLIPRDKVTALPWAPKVARKLLRYRANVDIVDSHQLSPLHYAIKYCNPRAKFGSTLETGRIYFKASVKARVQFKTKKYSPTLKAILDSDVDQCWRLITKPG